MTMDGVEVVGSQPHAATSPFLLSSPPMGHHHHHHHATFNLQSVQLSFDACLPYNAASSSSGSVTCGTSVNATCTNSSSTSCDKSTPSLSLAPSVPLHMQLQISSTASPEHNHGRHHQHHHHHRLDDHHQHQLHVANASSPSTDTADKRHQPDDDDKSCIRNCRNDIHDTNDKDKPGDLNTPVTTSSDLPSFFGPSALVEPPPISGTYISLILKTRETPALS
ncbi:protein doublesex-like, partial [Pogonomyrmex barbatus]|uniref:Protein doublesex-like n=1 Tax=Pogonomyrmex barbatus TaxID=144034 RepID=A0A8N1S9H0_9HYME